MKKYALFSGCMISLRLPHLEASAVKVLERLGVKLTLLKNVTCCPEPNSMKILNPKAWYVIAARNVCLSEQLGLNLLTLCSGCNATLSAVNEILKVNSELRDEVNSILREIGMEFEGRIEVKSVLRVLSEDVGPNEVRKYVKNPLHGMRVAVHYGCHSFEEIGKFDNPKNPKSLKNLVEALGATVVSYPSETMCCGGVFSRHLSEELSTNIIKEKIIDLIGANVDCLVVICPYCFLQFDLGQIALVKNLRKIPILYLTQLIGLAMGYSAYEMGLQFHKIKIDNGFYSMDV